MLNHGTNDCIDAVQVTTHYPREHPGEIPRKCLVLSRYANAHEFLHQLAGLCPNSPADFFLVIIPVLRAIANHIYWKITPNHWSFFDEYINANVAINPAKIAVFIKSVGTTLE